MRLKLYRARSVAEAIGQVRAELGLEALILSTRRVGDGVELTAALELQDPPPLAASPPPLGPSNADMLRFHGVPASLALRLQGDDLRTSIAGVLRFQNLPLEPGGKPLLLAGLPGAGKTLTIARLATRMVLAGIIPMLITADGQRAGAAEELAAFTRLLGIGLVAAATPSSLARALQGRHGDGMPAGPVLIDTAGANPFVAAELNAIAALAGTCDATIVMVTQAGMDAAEAGEQAAAFAQIGARLLLPTRFDLARRIGSVIAAAAVGDLALTEAGTGPGATGGLERLTPDSLTKFLLAPMLRRNSSNTMPEASHA